MVTFDHVRDQLAQVGSWPTVFGRPEKRELVNILHQGERIMQASMGWYQSGTALLVATDQRILLIDKKLMYLNVEALRYDMIAEVSCQVSVVDASVVITYAMKNLHFRSFNISKLRQLTSYMQQRVLELQQHSHESLDRNLNGGQQQPFNGYDHAVDRPQITDYDLQPLPESNYHDPAASGYEMSHQGGGPSVVPIANNGAPVPAVNLPRNPYRTSPFRRRKLGGFITTRHFRR